MPVRIEISNDDIKKTERILLEGENMFDDEREVFIKNFSTVDLQAVPGSGKTTALLAKLIAIEEKLPFDNGSGVLVLSHTNAAIDEIKETVRIHSPKLLRFPNYIGTIQSFVNSFLAAPYASNVLDTRLSIIDDSRYKKEVWNNFLKIEWDPKYGKPTTYFYRRHIGKSNAESRKSDLSAKSICRKYMEAEIKSLYYDPINDTINTFRDDSVILRDSTKRMFKGIKKCITDTLYEGIISYKYAYKLGRHYCNLYPKMIHLLQKRFSHVFVDEMQDMNYDQYNILEDLFYSEGKSETVFQRIGDKNQSIYDGRLIDEEVWVDRDYTLKIQGSHRLSVKTSNLVGSFSLYGTQDEDYTIKSLAKDGIKPHLIVYESKNIEEVIPTYASIIKDLKGKKLIPEKSKYPHSVIAWNTDWKTEEELNDTDKIRLIDYYPDFKKRLKSNVSDFENLYSFINCPVGQNNSFKEISNNINNAILKALRIEGFQDENQRYITKRKLVQELRENYKMYQTYKSAIWNSSIEIADSNFDNALSTISDFIEQLLKYFGAKVNYSKHFISSKNLDPRIEPGHFRDREHNKIVINDIELELNTVHSVKGKTHSTTLYLESYYQKYYESYRLADQLKGVPFPSSEKRKFHKHSTIMMYVGLSRARDLVCVSISKENFDAYLSGISVDEWEVIHI
ncbi:UvrD-helicase domain-containing protein [bacterium]|nr:UvrD-helicase domain-containing protein [bacterium]